MRSSISCCDRFILLELEENFLEFTTKFFDDTQPILSVVRKQELCRLEDALKLFVSPIANHRIGGLLPLTSRISENHSSPRVQLSHTKRCYSTSFLSTTKGCIQYTITLLNSVICHIVNSLVSSVSNLNPIVLPDPNPESGIRSPKLAAHSDSAYFINYGNFF